jgi:succinyl-diaminopimelate desuccinylase
VAIADWLDERADEMAALVEALVRVPTENPPGRELARCADVLSEALERLGFAPERLEQDAIVRGTVGDGDALVYYHGHFDVVPAQSRSQFEPVRGNGRIVGRGTADMKGGLVSMLYGAAARASSACWKGAGSSCTSSATRRRAAPPDPAICVRPA